MSCYYDVPMNVSFDSLKEKSKKVGYLKKLGGAGLTRNWRKRFFVLTSDGYLYYFKHRTSSTPVGALNLANYTKVYKDVDSSKKKKNFILINENDPRQRVFHLISDSDKEMGEWIEEITEFFKNDVSDLQNQLNDLKLKKQGTTRKKTQVKKVEEYDLDKLQLVLRGGRLSISIKNSGEIPSLLSIATPSPDSLLHSSPNQFDIPLDKVQASNSFLKFNSAEQDSGEAQGEDGSSIDTASIVDEAQGVVFHDDDDDDDDDGSE